MNVRALFITVKVASHFSEKGGHDFGHFFPPGNFLEPQLGMPKQARSSADSLQGVLEEVRAHISVLFQRTRSISMGVEPLVVEEGANPEKKVQVIRRPPAISPQIVQEFWQERMGFPLSMKRLSSMFQTCLQASLTLKLSTERSSRRGMRFRRLSSHEACPCVLKTAPLPLSNSEIL